MITAACAMVKCLEKENIKFVFGYPGAAICPFYDALSHSDIHHILVRQEQNAGHAASGYARINKKPAVCIATSGPGALNLITAIATAYMDSIPLIIITGQVPLDNLGSDVFQEADITGAAEPFVKHSYLIKKACDIPAIFKEAFYIASTGRQGPVLIDVPQDVQSSELIFEYPLEISMRSYSPPVKSKFSAAQINELCTLLKKSKYPLICAGGGVISSNSQEKLLALSKNTGIPIVTTMMGISAIAPDYPLNLGMIGMYGNNAANTLMNLSDLVILIGARVGDRAIMSPIGLSEQTVIVHIDIDPAEIGKNIKTNLGIVGDAKEILTDLLEKTKNMHFANHSYDACLKECKSLKATVAQSFISPLILMEKLCQNADDNAIITADVGQNLIWAVHGYKIKNGRFLASCGMGTMGYAIPCAIGAKLASGTQVIAVCGDGGFQMSQNELATICDNNLDIKIILFNNSCLGMIKELQEKNYHNNKTAVLLNGSPDYIKLAAAYNIDAMRICNNDEIPCAIEKMLSSKGCFLLECIIDPNEKSC